MRICTIQGMIAILICGVTLAHNNYGQVLDREISISVTEVSFDETLMEIAQQAHVKFAYSPELLNIHDRITFEAQHRSLREILNEILLPRKVQYVVQKNGITISLKRNASVTGNNNAIENSDTSTKELLTQFLAITGTVKDASNQLLAGVNIIVKGSTNGTTTDVDGNFSINAEENDVLIFSFIGFTSEEVRLNGQTKIEVILNEETKSLNEVVVNVGYWEVKQKEQTGNVSRITAKEIETQNVSNPLQALQGRMAGVYVQQNSGMPGGALKIQIRGQNSLRNGSDGGVNGNLPLYLIDGVPFTSTSLTSPAISGGIAGGNPLSTINPNDIESIEVLKDADATAIYGSRGANGVVLITTKRAKKGKAKLNLDFYQGVGKVSHFMDMLNTSQYLEMRKEGFANDNQTPSLSKAPDLLAWDTTRTTNWQNELIGGTAHMTNANVSYSGGDQQTQFLLSGAYYRETTVFPGTNSFQRGSGRFFVRHQSRDNKFIIESSLNYSTSVSDIPATDFTSLAVSLSPNAPALYKSDGELNWENGTWTNPLAVQRRKYANTIDNLVSNASLSYEIINGLSVKSNLGYTTMVVEEIGINPISSFDPQYASVLTGYSNFGDGKLKTWIIEPMIDYNTKIGKGHLTTLIGGTFQKSNQINKSLTGYGYTNDGLLENLGAAATIVTSSNTQAIYKYTAAFARVNYNWADRYIINLTGRRDGSSRFGPHNRFANFGAIGAAWIFSNENFLKDNAILNTGKLRASIGTSGSDAIGNYQFLETFVATKYPYGGAGGLTLNRLANPDYSWETNKKAEVGIELGFLNDRINFSTSFYSNVSSSQLVGLPLPIMTGQSSVQFNLPATVQNRGWEFQTFSTNIKTNKVTWNTSFNISFPTNTLLEFPNLENFPAYGSKYDVGESIYRYKGYQSNGVNEQTGLYQVRDLNGDGSYSSANDLIGLKENTQSVFGGLGNTIRWRNLEIDFLFQFVKQNGFGYQQSFGFPGSMSNQPTAVMQRWKQDEPQKEIQRFSAVDPFSQVFLAYYYYTASDAIIVDASFIRLKNASISWYLPTTWMKKLNTEGSRVFIQGQNLLTFTNYIGLDPETLNSRALPPLRVITAGIHISL